MLNRSSLIAGVFCCALLAPIAAFAETVNGEITKLNSEAQKITIKHGPIKSLDMGSMTMVFKAADPKMLEGVKVGDKVKFEASRVNGQITVTKIQKR